MGLELPGDDFSTRPFEMGNAGQPRRGRPSEIEFERLQRNVTELQFALEQNWGVVGWLLWQSEHISEIQAAFRTIVNPRCGLLEPFIQNRTIATTATEVRKLRKIGKGARALYRRELRICRDAERKCKQAFDAWAAESDPVKRVQLQVIRASDACNYEEAEALEKKSRLQVDSLESELRGKRTPFPSGHQPAMCLNIAACKRRRKYVVSGAGERSQRSVGSSS